MTTQVRYKKIAIWESTYELLKLLAEFFNAKITELVNEIAIKELRNLCNFLTNGKTIKEIRESKLSNGAILIETVLQDGTVHSYYLDGNDGKKVTKSILYKCMELTGEKHG